MTSTRREGGREHRIDARGGGGLVKGFLEGTFAFPFCAERSLINPRPPFFASPLPPPFSLSAWDAVTVSPNTSLERGQTAGKDFFADGACDVI